MKTASRKSKKLFFCIFFISAFFLLSSFFLSSVLCETVHYDFDSSSSKLIFHGKSTLHNFEGTVTELSGFAEGDTANIDRNAKGMFHVNVKSMKSESEKMSKNMLEDMESGKYPTIDFELSDVTVLKLPYEEKSYSLVSITGILMIHGVKKKITFPAEVVIDEKDFNLKADVQLSLENFNIKPAAFLFFMRVKDRIDLDINIHGTRN